MMNCSLIIIIICIIIIIIYIFVQVLNIYNMILLLNDIPLSLGRINGN